MSLTVQMKPDYTSVMTRSMQKLGTSNAADMTSLTRTMLGEGGDSTFIDYAAIKNGSYGKLMKAYYSEVDNPKPSTRSDDKKSVTDLVSDAISDKSSSKDSKKSKESTYNAAAEKMNNLSEQVSTLFNQYI